MGNEVSGKVVRIVPFGAFVMLEDGVDGLVHISQISWDRVEKVEDALQIGQEISAKVLELDVENKKISLSIKQMTEKPVKEAPAAVADGKQLKNRKKKFLLYRKKWVPLLGMYSITNYS